MQIQGTVALVTGAASGLGAATAALLAGTARRSSALDLPASVDKAPAVDGVRYVAADVTSESEVTAALEGIGPLRIVINCAGIAPARRILSSKGSHELDLFRRTIEVNLVGTFNVLRLAAAVIAEQEPSTSRASAASSSTRPRSRAFEGQIGQIAYSASKGGVVGMTVPPPATSPATASGLHDRAGHRGHPLLSGPRARGQRARSPAGCTVPAAAWRRPDEYAQLAAMIVEHDYLNGETIRMDGALRMAPQ